MGKVWYNQDNSIAKLFEVETPSGRKAAIGALTMANIVALKQEKKIDFFFVTEKRDGKKTDRSFFKRP
ncbi:MAG: hypothetical protein B6U86_03595 [Candidatus Altiarchaeales archaeon ex4484_43]|nr:MAG: hypothetical protein B6U86_03595 [Candidatus Altiarchaeales archaeon ex4484_43]RLI89473.1 MAG: hypothetical protein DRO62_01525 [Candidatus Altiarchaeales archaeon]